MNQSQRDKLLDALADRMDNWDETEVRQWAWDRMRSDYDDLPNDELCAMYDAALAAGDFEK